MLELSMNKMYRRKYTKHEILGKPLGTVGTSLNFPSTPQLSCYLLYNCCICCNLFYGLPF